MKTSNVDPNIATSGQAQLSNTVAVDFRLSNQKGARSKDTNRMQFFPAHEDSASEFGMAHF